MKIICISEQEFRARVKVRPVGYEADVLACALLGDGKVCLKPEDAVALRAKYRPASEPTVKELATNFVGAMERWAAAGFQTLAQEQYNARGEVCDACEYWDGVARFGLGKCNAPGCGCTKLKRWLATEQCKHPDGSKWPEIKQPLPSSESGATA